MRIVCLIGADRSGKSTLAAEFMRRGWNYVHFDPPKVRGQAYAEYRGYVDRLARTGDPSGKYVLDRFMYCEFPYSRHYGRPTDMTPERMAEIEDDLLKLDPFAAVVYCETDLRSNWERIQAEGKGEFSDIGQLKALREEYRRVLSRSKLATVGYDFTAGDEPSDAVGMVECMGV